MELYLTHFTQNIRNNHCFGRSVKEVIFLTALLEAGSMKLTVGVESVKKNTSEVASKIGKKQA